MMLLLLFGFSFLCIVPCIQCTVILLKLDRLHIYLCHYIVYIIYIYIYLRGIVLYNVFENCMSASVL